MLATRFEPSLGHGRENIADAWRGSSVRAACEDLPCSISEIDPVDRSGQVLNRANASGLLPVQGMPEVLPDSDAFTLVLPLGADTAAEPPQGHLVLHLSSRVIAAGVRGRAVDAITVLIHGGRNAVAAVFVNGPRFCGT